MSDGEMSKHWHSIWTGRTENLLRRKRSLRMVITAGYRHEVLPAQDHCFPVQGITANQLSINNNSCPFLCSRSGRTVCMQGAVVICDSGFVIIPNNLPKFAQSFPLGMLHVG